MLPAPLQAARFKLVLERPYLYVAVWAVQPVKRPGIGTLAVDQYWRLYYDPDVFNKWSVDELVGVLYHEICHLLRDHASRPPQLQGCGEIDKLTWNISCDIAINPNLLDEGIKLPSGLLFPEQFNLPPYKLAEEYYDLMKNTEVVSSLNRSGSGESQNTQDGEDNQGTESDQSDQAGGRSGDGGDAPEEYYDLMKNTEVASSLNQSGSEESQSNPDGKGDQGTESDQSDQAGSRSGGGGDAQSEANGGKSDTGPSDRTPSGDASDPKAGDADGPCSSASSCQSGASSGQGGVSSHPSGGRVGCGQAEPPDNADGQGGKLPDDNIQPAPGAGRCGSCAHGHPEPWEDPAPGTPGAAPGIDQVEAEIIRRHVAQEILRIARSSQIRGELPEHWKRWAEAKLAPKVNWRRELASRIHRALASITGSTDYTYHRPSRRMDYSRNRKVIFPAMHQPTPRVAVVVDTSGSIDDQKLTQAVAEVGGILKATGQRESVHVLAVDAAVHSCRRVFRPEQVDLIGGGGTDMRVGIQAAEKLHPRPDIIVVITDCHTPWPETKPARDVIIVRIGNGDVPQWAHVINIQEEEDGR